MKIKFLLTDYYNDEEFMFKLSTGLKFVFISLGFSFSVLLFTYLLLKIDLIYFVANGYPGAIEFQDAFYDFVYSSLYDKIPYVLLGIVFIFVLGFYLSSIMLRPFKVIGKHCEQRLAAWSGEGPLDKKNGYSPDYLSDLKLLTNFSVFFFSKIDEVKENEKLKKIEIPQNFTRIHKPIFEKNFFFSYFFVIAIFALLASVGIFVLNNAIREQIYSLSQKFLSSALLAKGNGGHSFIEEQFLVADIAVYFFMGLHFIMYCLLGFHLYGKISGPAFAVFATMRSFLKGNYHNRIHLIGHYYLRDDCRKMNKYLDYVHKNWT